MATITPASVLDHVPTETLEWLLEPSNPAVALQTRLTLLGESPRSRAAVSLSRARNSYEPVAAILDAMHEDGSWDIPSRDYQKYGGSLWQIVFLGELYADGSDARIKRAAEYAFSRQKDDGTFSANPKARYFMPCLTANVGRGLARMGWATDGRVVNALAGITEGYQRLGFLGCSDMHPFTLSGYCHMLTPKVLLFLGEVPKDAWPAGAKDLRDACVEKLRSKEIFRSLPAEYREFEPYIWETPKKEREAAREQFLAEHGELHYGDKPGWLRFGFPLSYNSDALEALVALRAVGEQRRPEYEPALELVQDAADSQMRWILRTSFNGKMIGNVEKKGQPSKWLTLRALQVLDWFAD